MKQNRPTWDDYFMQITRVVASRSTCIRKKVGAIIVKNKRIISTGYNGTLSGLAHCSEKGCLRTRLNIPHGERTELCRGLHAEQNALLFAASYGVDLHQAVLYCTHQPCILCAKMIIQAGIKKVIFEGDYPDQMAIDLFNEANIGLYRMKNERALRNSP